jgi:hypothetical protein
MNIDIYTEIMNSNVLYKPIMMLLQNLMLCKCIELIQIDIMLFTLFSARKIRSKTERNTVLNHTNREQFIKHLTSPEGYFLISIFQFYNEQGEEKLDDAILHALFNGIEYNLNFGVCFFFD